MSNDNIVIKHTKSCCICKQSKIIDDYYTDKHNGHQSVCKLCSKKRGKKRDSTYRQKHDSEILYKRLLRNYNITPEQHKQMFISQNGMCAICDKVFANRRDICVDHNHTTGQVRQLLCNKCNTMIGWANEDIHILSKAIQYLNKWNNVDKL